MAVITAGYKGSAGDCVVRSMAIATGLPYQEIYDLVNKLSARERTGKRKRGTEQHTDGCSQIHNQMGDGIAGLEMDSNDANRLRMHGSLAGKRISPR